MSIASFGGIFGLCLGGSVISLVEFGYFFTIRLIMQVTANRNQSRDMRNDDAIEANDRKSNAIFTIQSNRKLNKWNRE